METVIGPECLQFPGAPGLPPTSSSWGPCPLGSGSRHPASPGPTPRPLSPTRSGCALPLPPPPLLFIFLLPWRTLNIADPPKVALVNWLQFTLGRLCFLYRQDQKKGRYQGGPSGRTLLGCPPWWLLLASPRSDANTSLFETDCLLVVVSSTRECWSYRVG